MDAENTNSEQVSDSNVDTSAQDVSNVSEETQQTSTQGKQEDTSIKTNGSEVGLQKSDKPSDVEAGESFSENLDKLVSAAINGELSEEQRQQLAEAGIDKHFDLIVSGRQAEIAKNDSEIMGVVGSKEAYGELQEWALANLDDTDIASFNHAVLKSGDIGLAKLAVEGLQARYLRANGQDPNKVIESGGTSNEGSRPYSNPQEYIRDTMDIKYKQDPEFAAKVEAKRNLSGF
jgi:hypothetical protein